MHHPRQVASIEENYDRYSPNFMHMALAKDRLRGFFNSPSERRFFTAFLPGHEQESLKAQSSCLDLMVPYSSLDNRTHSLRHYGQWGKLVRLSIVTVFVAARQTVFLCPLHSFGELLLLHLDAFLMYSIQGGLCLRNGVALYKKREYASIFREVTPPSCLPPTTLSFLAFQYCPYTESASF